MPYFEQLHSILTRYQHHVAEYDKAKWELTVEQRILHGINHIPTKSAKLQSELIDLDLVRGSAFPKAKPKQSFFFVIRQALLRFLFLPLYYSWWTQRTSPKLFKLFFVLYITQLATIIIHLNLLPTCALGIFNNATVKTTLADDVSASEGPRPFGPIPSDVGDVGDIVISEIQTSEILSPIFLMIVLTILHSQIVATHGHKGKEGDKLHSRNRSVKLRRNSGSPPGKPRSKRRHSRHSQRRRSASKIPSFINSGRREGSQVSQEHCHASRRVAFLDESKSWTSSNSDKDEGIVDEMVGHENLDSGENESEYPSGSRRVSRDVEIIVEKGIIEANLNATIRKFAEEEALAIRQQNELFFPTKEDLEHCDGPGPEENHFVEGSGIRKRNLSKASEFSTTSPADYSSNNNDSTTEDEYREATMDDEEVRSKSEWTAVTTNSEDDDYEDDNINSEDDEMTETQLRDHPFAWEFQKPSMKNISPSCASADKISCTIFDGPEAMKADLTVLDISSSIIAKVERAKENSDYIYLGMFCSIILAFLPCFWRLNYGLEIDDFHIKRLWDYIKDAVNCAFGDNLKFQLVTVMSVTQRLILSFFVFFLLALAEKTYKQRFLNAKLFSRLTSSRKARKSGIPHFRLNKVRNIKTWLSIRSYLQRRGPQRSVDIIVSGTFITTLFLIFFLSVELLKDLNRMYYLYNVEVIAWFVCLGFYLMRFMTLGSRISQKYRNLSVILTEQLNLYLKMEQKPHKKDELLVANNVLKLASELLKELEDPFKISSFASNPYLYNVTRLVILSAFSGVLSEMLGFKLKLYKIKIK